MNSRPNALGWHALPLAARVYVVTVIAGGAAVLVAMLPSAFPHPTLFAVMTVIACFTSLWKINLPIPLASGSTLSVSHAAYLMALLLLGPRQAIVIAVAGSLTQCTFKIKQHYPVYRTAFSVSAEAVTMAATSLAYTWLDGPLAPTDFSRLPQPLVGAIVTYFIVNTGLVAGAIALSTGRSLWNVWRDDFLWSGASFAVASGVGAVAAVVVARGDHWLAVLLLAPVYLTYRSYELFVGRLEDQRRHLAETQRLHQEAVDALLQAREAERELAEERERLVVTLRSIGDGVITTDLDGTILSINNVAEKLTGWTNDEAVGKSLNVVFQTFDPETREPCDKSVALLVRDDTTLGVSRRSTILAERDLTEHPIEESTAPIRNADGRTIGMVLAFRDISDSLRIQEERAKAGKLESLGLLAGGIAHDFNNILMSVMGNVSMARTAMPRTGMSGNWLAEAEQACVRARQLTWQLLTFSKGGVPTRKTIAIERLLQESAALALRGSSISCRLEIAPDLSTVEADSAQLVQVFSNVLINAQQAMPHGGVVTITAENVVEGHRRMENALPVEPRRYVRVSITDKGIGIPKEHLSRIFDPYFSTKQRGSGLGLATTYSIVKNHGGFLAVDSQLGRGTTVQINFPAAGSRAVEDQPVAAIRKSSSKHRVLIMDDEAAIRTLAANMLEFLGYETEVVDGGSAAVERFQRALESGHPFDVVLLDLSVPGDLGGTEAMDRLGSLDPGVKTILMSGFAQDPVVTQFRTYGFNAVITKPFSLQELSTTLHAVITPPEWRVH
ncbi:MAG TPA: ATP-binding protein [Vicinamibacterales bacterium]